MVVIAAVDRTDRARNVVAEAASLAAAFDDTVHVVHVLSRSEFVELEQTEVRKSGRAIGMDRIRDHAAELARRAAGEVDASVEFVGLVGDAADRILEYADDHDARYVIVGPRKRSPTGKALFGSVAQTVLLNASCPVVVTTSGS